MSILMEDLIQTLVDKNPIHSSIFFSNKWWVVLFHFTCFDHKKRKWKKTEIIRTDYVLVLHCRFHGKCTWREFDPENINLFAYKKLIKVNTWRQSCYTTNESTPIVSFLFFFPEKFWKYIFENKGRFLKYFCFSFNINI